MKGLVQKINLMSALTSMDSISGKILESSSLKDKEIKRIVESSSRKKAILKGR